MTHETACHEEHSQLLGRLNSVQEMIDQHIGQFHVHDSTILTRVTKNEQGIDTLVTAMAGPIDPLTGIRKTEEGSAWKTDHLYRKLGNGNKMAIKLGWKEWLTASFIIIYQVADAFGVWHP